MALVSPLPAAPPAASTPAQKPALAQVEIKVIPNLVKFDITRFDVVGGAQIQLLFSNSCVMPHNLVILQPAAEAGVIAAVNALGLEGMDKGFVPEVPGIVAATKLLQPQQKQTIQFQAPAEPGDYPFVCTFPGHWFTMRGVMHVLAPGEKAQGAVRDREKVVNVPDALKDSGVTHRPLGTMAKPLVMRTFVPDPGLDEEVFAHHGVGKTAVKYDPNTREDLFDKKVDKSTGKTVLEPKLIPAQPGIPGAIAVSHGSEFSYVWDTTECRLLYAWRGGFLDMNPYWGKEPGGVRAARYIPKIEGALIYRASGPAPLSGGAGEAPIFGGYRMLEGAPEFWYRLGARLIRERVIPRASEGFDLEIRQEGGGADLSWSVSAKDASAVKAARNERGIRVSIQDRPEPEAPKSPTPEKTPKSR
jgi:azurin